MLRGFALGALLLGLTPGVAVALGGFGKQPHFELPKSSTVAAEPWGLTITPRAVGNWQGPLPVAAPLPDRATTPLSAASLQSAVQTHAAAEIRSWYRAALERDPRLAGELVASLLARRDGTVDAVVDGAPDLQRSGVGSCVKTAMSAIPFAEMREPL